jgi:hypothetical protein
MTTIALMRETDGPSIVAGAAAVFCETARGDKIGCAELRRVLGEFATGGIMRHRRLVSHTTVLARA